MADVTLRKVVKRYDDVEAVRGIDLDIADKEFVVLVGPSGCGKSTTLRMIAGLEDITDGDIMIGGDVVNDVPPKDRDIAMVFQNYALYPHMTVAENMSFGLRLKHYPKAEIKSRVTEAARMLDITDLIDRKPKQLSGGQRQRVALARALVVDPAVLLLDEPLGALDLKLREQMQVELKQMQRDAGITFVFVTHDQGEALTMSDRVAVFDAGRLAQVGTPEQVYESPATGFVAGFVGTSNLLSGAVARSLVGRDGTFSVRPEKISLGETGFPGTVAEVIYAGPVTRFVVDLDAGARMVVVEQNRRTGTSPAALRGRPVRLSWDEQHVIEIPDTVVDTKEKADAA
jgi:putative spermidine/putrescine transport system ATP-binding protein